MSSQLRILAAHFQNELRLKLYLARRYWFESLFGLALILALFVGLLLAISSFGDSTFSSGKFDGLLVGFTLWMFATTAYASSSHEIADETRSRTIEQLCVAPIGLSAVLACRAAIRVASGCLFLLVALATLAVATDGRTGHGMLRTIAIATISAPSLIGVGYLMGGLVLVVKRAEVAQALVYPCLVLLVAVPVEPSSWLGLLPYSLGASTARVELSGAASDFVALGLIACNSLAWFCMGFLGFRMLEHQAKRRGLLGHM